MINNNLKSDYIVYNNFPNPFNPVTNIQFKIEKPSFVRITIFDILGRKIEELVNENKNPGEYKYQFSGQNLNSGMYFVKYCIGKQIITQKIILVK